MNNLEVCNGNYSWKGLTSVLTVIGASLSEPHTSVTALRTRVSIRLAIYGPTTYWKF